MMSKLLIILVPISFLALSFDNHNYHVNEVNCNNFRVELEITQPGEKGNVGGIVKVKVQNAKPPIRHYFLTKDKKKALSLDFDKNELTGIEKGTYFCFVVDSNGCNKEIKFTID